MMMKKLIAILLVSILMMSVLAGCSSSSSGKSKGEKTVTIWSWRKQDKKIWTKVEAALNKQGKNIKIDFRSVTPTEYNATLQTAMNGGKGPDILTMRAGTFITDYAKANQIVALNDDVPQLSNFTDGIISQVSKDGKAYAVPSAVQTSQFFYNKKIFKKYNLSEPKSWDEFMNDLKTLKKHGVTPMAVSGREGWALNLIVDTVGATQLGDEWTKGLIAGKNKFNDPKFVAVLSKINAMKPYFQKGYSAASYQDMETMFTQGQAAIIDDGIWAVNTLQSQNPDLEIGSFMAPPADSSQSEHIYAFLDGGYGLNAKANNKKAAIEVLKYTGTKEYGQMYTDMFGEMSAYPGISPSKGSPSLNTAIDRFKNKSISQLFRIRSPFDGGDPDISTLMSSDLQSMFAGKNTPQKTGDNIQKNIAKWYKPFQ